ncbi:LpxL/LpxP family acyltransferase [Hyalangium versicolor]|uniref:LpxL/LpxP family acyltransferase n=1 Tax=Hyalangium versicolor TaxID=2861190 RepID=UPI001CCAB609|nr:hypothetical protein [Hyalangium versicolor]
MQASFFHPYRFYLGFEFYSCFSRFDHESLCDIMTRIFEKESALAAPRSESDPRIREIAGYLRRSSPSVGDAEQRALEIAREGARIFLLDHLVLLLSLSRPGFFDDIVKVKGIERLKELIREDGSCLLVTPHIGPHFILTLILAKLGVRVMTGGGVTQEFVDAVVRIVQHYGLVFEQLPGFTFTDDFKARCEQLIASGTSIMLYPEYSRSARRGNLVVDFLGSAVHAPTGIARLAQQARRRVVMAVLRPRAPFTYELSIGPEWSPPPSGDEAAVEDLIRSIFQHVEQLVVEQPEAWMGWEFFGTMKGNALEAMSRQFSKDRGSGDAGAGA